MSRRLLLGGAVGVALGLVGCEPLPSASRRVFARWVAERTEPYFIAHRGAGTVVPEHSLEGYLQALAWGAQALEISVVSSADGVLYCLHDLTLDRTTTITGRMEATTSAVVDAARLDVPRLGPAWQGDRRPVVPKLADVLAAVGNRAVLCIEAKDDKAFEPMMAMLAHQGLLDTVMVKAPIGSRHLEAGRKAGLPLFGYLGSGAEVTVANIAAAAKILNTSTDALILPTRMDGGAYLDADLVARCVATGVTVWLYSTHRRSEVAHYTAAGVRGFVTPAVGYLAGTVARQTSDTFAEGHLEPGLLTQDPYSDSYALDWSIPGSVVIRGVGRQTPLTLGSFGPLPAESTRSRLEFEASVVTELKPAGAAFGVTVCTASDASPADEGVGGGYVVTLDHTGRLSVETNTAPRVLLVQAAGAAPPLGSWQRLRVQTDHDTLTVECGAAKVSVRDTRWRGGYAHLWVNAAQSRVAFRGLTIA